MGTVKITLTKPVTLLEKSGPVAELTFRDELCTGDFRGMKVKDFSDPSFDDLLRVGSRLCGQPEELLNKISLQDFNQVVELIMGFLSVGQATGTLPSPS